MEESAAVLTTRSIPRPLEIVDNRTAPAEFWLWPNKLSLQAPVVAVLWQILLAQSLGVRVDPFAPWALGMAVWLIYVADHLIDTARLRESAGEPPRKQFCRRHWETFLVMAIVVACVLAAGAIRFLPTLAVEAGWPISVGVAGYFALIHLTPKGWRRDWPRELVVATIFTLGTFCVVWSANGQRALPLLAPAVTFLVLCGTNCSLIEAWEWEESGAAEQEAPNRAARWVAKHLGIVGIAIAMAAGALRLASLLPGLFASAVVISGVGLFLLARCRHVLPIRFVSPVADLALCSPLLCLLWTWLVR